MDLAKIQEALKGRKTYIALFALAVVSTLQAEGVIDGATASQFQEWIMYFGGASLVAKMNRMGGGAPNGSN